MNCEGNKIFGLYSHKNGHAQIFDCTSQVRDEIELKGKKVTRISPRLVYDKLVTYRTYMRNFKRIKDNLNNKK